MMNEKYIPLDLNDLAGVHTSSQKSATADDSKYLRLPDGNCSVVLRLLPAKAGEKRPYSMYQSHKLRGKMYICRRVPNPTPQRIQWTAPPDGCDCPVCQYYKTKYAKFNPGKPPKEIEDVLREIKPMVRTSWNVVARQLGDKKNVGPLVWTCGIQVAQKIWGAILGDVKLGIRPKGDIFHPQTGRDLLLVKKMDGPWPKYEVEILDPVPAGTPEEWERWLQGLHDLNPMPNTYEELRHALAVHMKVEEDDDGGFDVIQFEKKQVVQHPKRQPVVGHVEEDMVVDHDFAKELADLAD
jgi:hypothetical protein